MSFVRPLNGVAQAPGLRRGEVYRTLFTEAADLLEAPASEDAFVRSLALRRFAREFYQAMAGRNGADWEQAKRILAQVHAMNVFPAFDREVAMAASQEGHAGKGALALIEEKCAGNWFKRLFKGAQKKELQDILRTGRNQFRASAWEYRRLGMWQSVADFVTVCRRYPVASTGIIGATAYLGHKYPFLGGVSGIAIIGWGGVVSLLHELKALRIPGRGERKAEHYISSGENLAAVLITGLGLKGIKSGTLNGLAEAKDAMATLPGSRWAVLPTGALKAISATSRQENKVNALQSLLFVSGLFDNVLLPFNWLADKLKNRK